MEQSKAAITFPQSGIRRMFEKASLYDDAINMSLGEPGFITPHQIIKVGADNLLEGKTKYTPNAGIFPLRSALAEKLVNENNIRCDPAENVMVTAGATQALMLIMLTLVNPGEEVVIPNPGWPDYLGQVMMANATPVFAELREEKGFKMTAEVIEPLITSKTKLIMVNSPSNPTGAMLSAGELEDIADLVRRRKVFVISDEPYEKLIYDDNIHTSLASFPGLEEYAITVNSFSKTYAMTGWRVGYVCANRDITANLIKLHENMIASINEAFQWAAIEALQSGSGDVKRMRQTYDKNRRTVVERLNRIRGVSCLMPQGAFYAFPNVKGLGGSSVEVAEMILAKTHVVTSPGSAFGSAGEGYLRISYANSHDALVAALDRLENELGAK